MIINGQKVNFDRIVRVTLIGWQGCIVEYCPLADESLIARIEFETLEIPSKNNPKKPGYTATVKLYNVDDRIATCIANNQKWLVDYVNAEMTDEQKKAAVKKYYSDRLQLRLEAGYWNHEGNKRDYKPLFEGFVNSSYTYRKGQDYISVLQCYNFMEDTPNNKAILDSISSYSEDETITTSENRKGDSNWNSTFHKFVSNFAIFKKNPLYHLTNDEEVFPKMTLVTDEDRKNGDFFIIRYATDATGKKADPILASKLSVGASGINTSSFYSNESTLYGLLSDLCKYKNSNCWWTEDYDFNTDKVTYIIYPKGSGSDYTESDKSEIQIVNYQNLLEAPTVTGGGSLTIRMLFEPTAKPLLRVALIIKDVGTVNGTSNSSVINASSFSATQQSINANLQSGNFTPLVQGPYSMSVYSQEKMNEQAQKKGYLFNIGFPIIRVEHKGDTHSPTWETNITTAPTIKGIFTKDLNK